MAWCRGVRASHPWTSRKPGRQRSLIDVSWGTGLGAHSTEVDTGDTLRRSFRIDAQQRVSSKRIGVAVQNRQVGPDALGSDETVDENANGFAPTAALPPGRSHRAAWERAWPARGVVECSRLRCSSRAPASSSIRTTSHVARSPLSGSPTQGQTGDPVLRRYATQADASTGIFAPPHLIEVAFPAGSAHPASFLEAERLRCERPKREIDGFPLGRQAVAPRGLRAGLAVNVHVRACPYTKNTHGEDLRIPGRQQGSKTPTTCLPRSSRSLRVTTRMSPVA